MKPSDIKSIATVVGKLFQIQFSVLKSNVDALIERMKKIETREDDREQEIRRRCAEIMAETIDQLRAELKAPSVEEIAAKVRGTIEIPAVPTAKEIAAEVSVQAPPTAQEIAEIVLRDLPLDDIAKRVEIPAVAIPSVPTAKEIAAEIQTPPSAQDVAAIVMQSLPLDEIAKLVHVPSVDEIAERVYVPPAPTAEDIAKHVAAPLIPTAEEIAKLVPIPVVPSAEEIAKFVPIPELPPMPELPELPKVPTFDEIMAGVKQILPSLIPDPVKGDKGDKGDGVTVDDVRPMLESLVKALPAPQDGKSVTIDDVRPLFSQWILEFERRASDRHDQILSQLPKPKDGKDGLGFEDLDVSMNIDAKEISIEFKREGVEPKSFTFFVPLLVHRGVYRSDAHYLEGDCVTRGGCTWMAVKTSPSGEPADGRSDDWRLIVKRGNDGRDATSKETSATRVRVAPRREK